MDAQVLLDRVGKLKVWSRGNERAPHKPLLLLYALARLQRGGDQWLSYESVDRDVGELLREFGPPRKSYHPEYPFFRLQHDELWTLDGIEKTTPRTGHADPRKSELLRHGVRGRLAPDVIELLSEHPQLIGIAAREVLDAHFPASLHEDLLAAVGLDVEPRTLVPQRARDPAFRERVLVAYERRCAICSYDVRLGDRPLGLEAAHIKWHQAGGPDTEPNGLALCTLHHKLFDRGAFTISEHHEVEVSELVSGHAGLDASLLRHHRKPLNAPIRAAYAPSEDFVRWHRAQVFRSPARE